MGESYGMGMPTLLNTQLARTQISLSYESANASKNTHIHICISTTALIYWQQNEKKIINFKKQKRDPYNSTHWFINW